MPTPEGFRRLADMLETSPPEDASKPQEQPADEEEFADLDERAADESAILRELRIFHARIAENVEAAVEMLIGDIAAEVLARELEIAPANIACIVERALERYASEEPLRVRVAPEQAEMFACGIPVVADERLREGDAIIELRGGSVDASLGVRLASVLAWMAE